MWGDTGGYDHGATSSGGGGGFLNNSFASPSAEGGEKKNSKDRRAENVVPVTIRQILESGEDFKISELPVHVLTIVALVKNIEPSATKISYRMLDSTGSIQVVQFLDGTAEEEQPLLNTYCRVFGTVRANQGNHYIMAFKIRPVTDLNELTTHLLEVIDVHVSAPLLSSEPDESKIAGTVKTEPLSNSMMAVGSESVDNTMGVTNSRHKMILGVIMEMAKVEEQGIDAQFIAQKLKAKLSLAQVRETLETLLQEGIIYTTVDDDHYTATK